MTVLPERRKPGGFFEGSALQASTATHTWSGMQGTQASPLLIPYPPVPTDFVKCKIWGCRKASRK